jgi:hypothetical protein
MSQKERGMRLREFLDCGNGNSAHILPRTFGKGRQCLTDLPLIPLDEKGRI